jgi:hypothetical protein
MTNKKSLDFGDRRHNLEIRRNLGSANRKQFRGYGACPRNPEFRTITAWLGWDEMSH